VQEGRRTAGYAVVTATEVLESGTLAQIPRHRKQNWWHCSKPCEWQKEIWTDSKYAFGVIHAHGAIWKEKGLLSARGSSIKHKEEILQLLKEVQKSKEVAVMHCKAYQFGQTALNIGN